MYDLKITVIFKFRKLHMYDFRLIMSLQVPKGTTIFKNLSESSIVVPRLASSTALQFHGILICPGTQMICKLYLFATQFGCF